MPIRGGSGYFVRVQLTPEINSLTQRLNLWRDANLSMPRRAVRVYYLPGLDAGRLIDSRERGATEQLRFDGRFSRGLWGQVELNMPLITYHGEYKNKKVHQVIMLGSHDAGINQGNTNTKTQTRDIRKQG